MKLTTILFVMSAGIAHANAEVPPPAYQRASAAQGVPAEILWAVAKVESNYRLKIGTYPWPWTLNVNGKAGYYRTRGEACAAAKTAIAQVGGKKVDIGLTQQNWGWVGTDFYSDPCDALDPNDNLRTASIRLRQCYEQERDWIMAAGCYHRPAGGEPARRYRESVQRKLQQLAPPVRQQATQSPQPKLASSAP